MIIFLICVLLVIALLTSGVNWGKWKLSTRILRFLITVGSIAYFSLWYVEKSISPFLENSLAVQVVNYLPQPIDFYLIRVNSTEAKSLGKYSSVHVGQIREDHFRIEYLNMQKSDEFWVAGFIRKNKLVYFSQVSVPNKNEDKIIEVQNYINNSLKLSAIATETIQELKFQNIKISIWVTLDFLLIFLNSVLLIRDFRKKKS